MNILIFILIIIIFKNIICFRFYKENNTLKNDFYNISISTFMNESILNYNSFENLTRKGIKNYFYIKYDEYNSYEYLNSTNNDTLIEKLDGLGFKIVNITNSTLNYKISYILSLNDISYSLIIIDYINSSLIIDNDISLYKKFVDNKNICYNNNNTLEDDKKFICKLEYLLFGHEDLKEDDVYLAKEIKEDNSIAYLDNYLSYSIFPEEYLDYFLTSFFSELNDECQKKEIELKNDNNDYNIFYYIICPKKKIEIYTKRRKLSVIINKISYKITDLFGDSLDFLNQTNNDDNYYFNIIFEKNRKNFILGIGFFKDKRIGYYDNRTYIYASERTNYTLYLTDINSEQFEIWLYTLTTFSFTFLLLIFTIIGCIHTRKVNKELREMLY